MGSGGVGCYCKEENALLFLNFPALYIFTIHMYLYFKYLPLFEHCHSGVTEKITESRFRVYGTLFV